MTDLDSLSNALQILLVEDDPGDVVLTEQSLKQSKVMVNLQHVENGIKALEYLHKQAQYANVDEPDLILLDLNLPGKDGREVLREIKSNENLKHIPVVILTTSAADEDILKTYDLGANCYVTKPVGLHEFMRLVKAIDNFWFSIVKLPKRR